LLSSQLKNDSNAGTDLDSENDTRSPGIEVLRATLRNGASTRLLVSIPDPHGGSWRPDSECEAITTSNEGYSFHTQQHSASDVLHAIFDSMDSHVDEATTAVASTVSVSEDMQSIVSGDPN
jgi:hypothetical protein